MRGPLVFCLNPAQNASLQKKDAADLTGVMMIDPDSLKLLPNDSTVRPGGVGCSVKATDNGYAIGVENTNLSLKLTEFPDPDGKAVYFRVPNLSVGVPDELLGGKQISCGYGCLHKERHTPHQ